MRALLTGTLAVALLTAYTLLLFALLAPLILLKLLTRPLPPIAPLDAAVVAIADTWNRLNAAGMQWASGTHWQLSLPEGLSRQAWYLVICNHQSWVDILVLQRSLQGRAPFLKFFIKRELIWVPLVGLVWWALDFPFLRRRGGASGAQDLATARAACARFRALPTSVMSFVEGTRFTPAKQQAQQSPFRHLLRPKAGGVMSALEVLGDRLERRAGRDHRLSRPGAALHRRAVRPRAARARARRAAAGAAGRRWRAAGYGRAAGLAG